MSKGASPGHIQEAFARPTVIRDSREKDGHGYYFKDGDYFAGTRVGKLESGDYSIEGMTDIIVIERKMGVPEISQNLTQKRFANEIERLKEVKHAFIVIEAPFSDVLAFPNIPSIPPSVRKRIRIRPNFILSRLTAYQLAGIHVVFADNPEGGKRITGYLLANAAKEYQSSLLN